MATDPVCGMAVDERTAFAKAQYQGMTFYFCSNGCHKAFVANPEKYAEPQKPEPGHGPQHGRR